MLKFLIIIVLFYFIMWLQVTHCDEIELDAEFSEFLSKFPFNLGQVFAEFKKNETYYRTQVFYGSECFLDIQRIFLGMTARKLWAFKVIDSWGKIPSGILNGDLYELGDFDECLGIEAPNNFEPQYCLARISKDDLQLPQPKSSWLPSKDNGLADHVQPRIIPTSSNMVGLNIGTCMPKTCTPPMIENFFKIVTKKLARNFVKFSIVPDTCQTKDDLGWNLNAYDFACLAFLLLLGVLMSISTIYDISRTIQNKPKTQIMLAFSIYTNGQKLFSCKKSRSVDSIECLNGIRVLSAIWVLYGHAHAMVVLGPIFNYAYIPVWASHYTSTILLLAPLSVDTFLFLSGLLVNFSILKHLKKTNGRINVPMLYFHRYLRLTPVLGVIIIISLTLFKKIGSGPLWHTYINNALNCDEYWWSALLYIQNYYNPSLICLSHTWYLSVDMQLFLAAPLFSYLLYRFKVKFLPVLLILILVSMGWTFAAFYQYQLVNQFLNFQNNIQDTFIITYYPTHLRLSPWLIGAIFAYYLFVQINKRVRWHSILVMLCWIAAAAIIITLSYYTYILQQLEHEATPIESGIFTPLSRVAWSIFLCFVIDACVKGYGGPVNWFLSLSIWRPLSRLTYVIYLVHMPIMLCTVASSHRPIYFTERNVIFKFAGDLMIAFLLSILASLALESPVLAVEKVIFECGKDKNTQRTTTDDAQTHPSAPSASEHV